MTKQLCAVNFFIDKRNYNELKLNLYIYRLSNYSRFYNNNNSIHVDNIHELNIIGRKTKF